MSASNLKTTAANGAVQTNDFSALPDEALLVQSEACAFLRVSSSFLEQDRCRKPPRIPFVKLGEGRFAGVKYRLGDVRAYVRSRVVGGAAQTEARTSR